MISITSLVLISLKPCSWLLFVLKDVWEDLVVNDAGGPVSRFGVTVGPERFKLAAAAAATFASSLSCVAALFLRDLLGVNPVRSGAPSRKTFRSLEGEVLNTGMAGSCSPGQGSKSSGKRLLRLELALPPLGGVVITVAAGVGVWVIWVNGTLCAAGLETDAGISVIPRAVEGVVAVIVVFIKGVTGTASGTGGALDESGRGETA